MLKIDPEKINYDYPFDGETFTFRHIKVPDGYIRNRIWSYSGLSFVSTFWLFYKRRIKTVLFWKSGERRGTQGSSTILKNLNINSGDD